MTADRHSCQKVPPLEDEVHGSDVKEKVSQSSACLILEDLKEDLEKGL